MIEALIRFEEEEVPGLAELLHIYTGLPVPILRGFLHRYDGRDFQRIDRYRAPYVLASGRNKGELIRGNFVGIWRYTGTSLNRAPNA